MKITIKGKEYNIKYTIRAMIIFEQVTKQMFQIKTLTDEYLFLYSLVMANNKDANLTFDDLLDAIDEDSNIMLQFEEFMKQEADKQQLFNDDDKKDDGKKKE